MQHPKACPDFGAILIPALHDQARAWQATIFELGLAGLHWPVEYGGQGLSHAHSAVWFEECARAGVAPYLNLQGNILTGEAVLRSGTDEQKRRILPSILDGSALWCQLFSEPNAGSDLAGLSTSAVADGDGFVVNGQKVWSSNAQFADFGILLARTDQDQPKHRGISFFCIDMRSPGIEIRPLKQMTGDEEFCEVFMTDVLLPADTLLGPLNDGWRVAMEVLGDERGAFGTAGVISLRRRMDALAEAGRGAGPVSRDALASLMGRGSALGAMLQRVEMASAAKLLRTELETDALALEGRVAGAQAMLAGELADRMLYAPGMRIAGGSSEVQRNILGERVLGLPREPRPS